MIDLYVAFVLRYTTGEDKWPFVAVVCAGVGALVVALGVAAVALAVCGSATGCK